MAFLRRAWRWFVSEETGQDLIEYTLLLAFVALASAALFVSSGQSVNGIWVRGNTVLHDANQALGSRHEDN